VVTSGLGARSEPLGRHVSTAPSLQRHDQLRPETSVKKKGLRTCEDWIREASDFVISCVGILVFYHVLEENA
jgi:hypothetical protein